MSDALTLLRRYRATRQHVRNLEFDLAQARMQRKRNSASILMDALHDAKKMVLNVEDEVDSFIKTAKED